MYRITDEPNAPIEDRRVVSEGLSAYNRARGGDYERQPVTLLVRDQTDMVVGGLLGQQIWGWLHVDTLWVAEAVRGCGIGSDLLMAAEAQARGAGCAGAFLETFDFQALEFYRRHGYMVSGVHAGFPPGHTHYYLQKVFAASAPPAP